MSELQQCHDLTRPLTECLDSPPVKGCVEEGMGGHPGAFTDIQLPGCNIACGKKITGDSETELAFYDDLYMVTGLPDYLESLKTFLPTYYPGEKCKKGDNGYFVIENIKGGVGDNVRTLDFKVGKKTAFGRDSGHMKRKKHKLLDTRFSHSDKIGFRLEGLTGESGLLEGVVDAAKKHKDDSGFEKNVLQRGKKKLQKSLYNLAPDFIFSHFFQTKKQVKDIAIELERLDREFIEPTRRVIEATPNEQTIGFIGSSILLVIGSDGGTFKLIDFAHPKWNNTSVGCCKKSPGDLHKKVVLNYIDGLKSFIEYFTTWRNMHYNDLPDTIELRPLNIANPQEGGRKKRKTRKKRKYKYKKKRTKKKARRKRRKTRKRRRKNK